MRIHILEKLIVHYLAEDRYLASGTGQRFTERLTAEKGLEFS